MEALMGNKNIYLDYAATTPVHPDVFEKMQPYFSDKFGNSASGLHSYGWDADFSLQESRKSIASILNCNDPKEIIFTSGATESNNWAIRGLIESMLLNGEKEIHILSSKVEHNSILKALQYLPKIYPQVQIEFLETNSHGQISTETILKKIRPTTKLMSFMWVNNELGSLNPIEEIGTLAREHKILFHTDATQAVGKIKIDFQNLPIDLLSFSGHKIYGPKGIGALLIRSQEPKVTIAPLFHGGGQEKGLRSGTVNIPGVVGLAKALEFCQTTYQDEYRRISDLKKDFLSLLSQQNISFQENGHPQTSIPHILNLTLPELSKYAQLTGFAYSKGSACHSGSGNMSHVLQALQFDDQRSEKTFRFSFGYKTNLDNLKKLSECIHQNIGGNHHVFKNPIA